MQESNLKAEHKKTQEKQAAAVQELTDILQHTKAEKERLIESHNKEQEDKHKLHLAELSEERQRAEKELAKQVGDAKREHDATKTQLEEFHAAEKTKMKHEHATEKKELETKLKKIKAAKTETETKLRAEKKSLAENRDRWRNSFSAVSKKYSACIGVDKELYSGKKSADLSWPADSTALKFLRPEARKTVTPIAGSAASPKFAAGVAASAHLVRRNAECMQGTLLDEKLNVGNEDPPGGGRFKMFRENSPTGVLIYFFQAGRLLQVKVCIAIFT